MKFLFTITAYSLNTPVIYTVSRVSEHEFVAETADTNMQSFTMVKQKGNWTTESGYTYDLSLRITRKIDKLNLDRYKTVQDFFRSYFKPAASANMQSTRSTNMVEQLANP